jgi:WD40 repeat protein
VANELASASWDASVVIWDLQRQTVVQKLIGHEKAVNTVAYSPNGNLLASASTSGVVIIWDVPSGKIKQQILGTSGAIAWVGDGKSVITVSSEKRPLLWDAERGVVVGEFDGLAGQAEFIILAPDYNTLAAASSNGTICLWNTSTGRKIRILEGHLGAVNRISFSADGLLLASKSEDGTIRIWSTEAWDMLAVFKETSQRSQGLVV